MTDVNQLLVTDQRGRRAVHQAAVRNRDNILQLIARYGAGINGIHCKSKNKRMRKNVRSTNETCIHIG